MVGEVAKGSAEAMEMGELLSDGGSFATAEEVVVVELWRRLKKGILRLGRRKEGYVGVGLGTVFDQESMVVRSGSFSRA